MKQQILPPRTRPNRAGVWSPPRTAAYSPGQGSGLSNAYSVNYDGTDDYMSTGGADDTKKDRTYTFWAKSTNTADDAKSTVFSHGSNLQGAFHFNWGAGLPLLYLGSGWWTKWNDTSAQDDSAWHFWAIAVDVDSPSTCLLYMDGALQTANSYSTAGAATGWSDIEIGRTVDAAEAFQGNLDEFCVFDGHLTAAEILTLWNNGVPKSPTSLSPEHWWRMGDDGGSGTFIPDHADLGVGAEMVPNGGFDSDSGWTGSEAGWTFTGGKAVATAAGNSFTLQRYDGGTLVVGKLYHIKFTVSDYSAGSISAQLGSGLVGPTVTANGDYSMNVACSSAAANKIGIQSTSASTTLKIDNLSVKLINGKPGTLQSGAAIQTDSP